MTTIFTLGASVAAALATVYVYALTGINPQSVGVLLVWSVGPYLAHAILAIAARRHLDTSFAILIGTLVSGVFANLVLANDFRPWIDARAQGLEPPMNCGGPLVEFGLPILQYLFLGVLGWVVLTARPADDSQPDEIVDGRDR